MKEKIIAYCDRAIEACLCLLIFCLPFTKAGMEVFTWLAIALWVIKRLLLYSLDKRNGLIPATKLGQALAIFLIINALSVVFSVNLGLSMRAFFGKIVKFVTLYYIVIESISNKKRLNNIIVAMISSAVLMTLDAGAQYFTGKDFLRGFPYERLRVSFPSANGFGGWLIMFIPVFLGIALTSRPNNSSRRRIKFLLGALVLSLVVSLLLTYSRGAWIGFTLGISLFFYYVIALTRSYKIKIFLPLLIICLIIIFFFTPQVFKERIASIRNTNANSDRISLWKESLNIIGDFPVLGTGLNTYSVVAQSYKTTEDGGTYPHNSYLQMMAETGVLGLGAFIWILIVFFKEGFSRFKKTREPLLLGLLAGVFAFLVQAFFDTHLYSLQLVVLFWFMAGLSVSVMKLGQDAVQ